MRDMGRKHRDEGMTFVELMVVVAIIGTLVAITVPVFRNARASATRSACQYNLRVLDGAALQWLAADADHDVTALGSTATDADELVEYVTDWEATITCPLDATQEYSVVSGDFTCGVWADHNYE